VEPKDVTAKQNAKQVNKERQKKKYNSKTKNHKTIA